MFYFFLKSDEYLRCELRADNGSFDLRILEPGFQERLERFSSHEAAMERWDQLRVQFNVDGWSGPFGRE